MTLSTTTTPAATKPGTTSGTQTSATAASSSTTSATSATRSSRRAKAAPRIKPRDPRPLAAFVRARARITPHMERVTLGGGELADFEYLGYDQWFRLYLPTGPGSLQRVPDRLTSASYARMMLAPASGRPTLRNYTVRAYRPQGRHGGGPEIDVDLVVHGDPADGTAGPASTWASTCAPGDEVRIYDEGRLYAPPSPGRSVLLVADETGLPATAGVLASLPADTVGTAVVEVPGPADRQALGGPAGVELRWVHRAADGDVPGRAALAAAREVPVPPGPVYAWTVGESDLVTTLRRHWVQAGVPKADITFCGYWKHGG